MDKPGPAFRCTCPSRKFPCKHGIALLLLLTQHPGSFSQAAPPVWVSEWLASRQQRAEQQEQKKKTAAEASDLPADPEAIAKREAARTRRMAQGLEELERWLNDLIHQGLAGVVTQAERCNEMAARMVDAQLPGIAYRLRQLATLIGKGEDWPIRVLAELGRLRLLMDGFRRYSHLPEPMQADLRTALGWTLDKDQVLTQGQKISDEWLVLGQLITEEERLWMRRVWLQGRQTGQRALLLDYAHGNARFDLSVVTGSTLTATLAFYPSASILRALPVDTPHFLHKNGVPIFTSFATELDQISTKAAGSPWQLPVGMLVFGVPRHNAGSHHEWIVELTEGHQLDARVSDEDGWLLLAESGGLPLQMFGEWDGTRLRLLSAWNSRLVWTAQMERITNT